jgi:hypothetical protein
MKKISLFLGICFVVFSFSGFAQFKITSNGNVGIHTSEPAYKLDINSMDIRSYYPGRNAFYINHNGTDPRLCSNDRIVFYKTDATGLLKIEFQAGLQVADGEQMENIISLENKGLPTISKIQGLTFTYKNDILKRKESGFIAQDLESVIPEAVYTNDSTKSKSLTYNSIIPYLVEAIKEQQIQIKDLTDKLVAIEEAMIKNNLITATQPVLTTKSATLSQNVPNPFSHETRISCYIPDSATSSILYNYDTKGGQSEPYRINGKREQVVTLDGNRLNSGIYLYSLVVDGKVVDTKKMILAK